MQNKIEVKKNTIEETLLLPLWGRAYEGKKENPRLIDEKALEIIEKLDYDFSEIEKIELMSQNGWVSRSLHIDRTVKNFIKNHPLGTIVNIGCGLDTTFNRIDNGQIMFYELDLPDVIKLRKNFFEDSSRHISIATSFLETEYFEQLEVRDSILFIAGGVLYYFSEEQIKEFFIKAIDYFKNCEFYFDSLSKLGMKIAKKQVLKKGGMDVSMDDKWSLESAKEIEKWDDRIKIISDVPMAKGMCEGVSLKMKILSSISSVLGVCNMMHVASRND